MAFATVAARQTGSTTTNAGTHSVTFPAGITNDEILLAFVAADGNPILDDSNGRWTKIGGQFRNGTVVTGACLAKIADGNDTLTVRTRLGDANQVQEISWVTMRVQNHGGLPVGVGANGSSPNSNPPAITPPWGTQDYLFIAARMGDSNVPATAAPSGYSNLTGVTHSDATNGACVHTAEKSANASTEDPGTFTSALEQWAAITIAIPPADAPGPKLWGSYEVTSVTSATTSLTSPSFSPADGEVLVAKASTAGAACVPSVATASAGPSFASQAQSGTSGSQGQSRLCTAVVSGTPGSITLTQPFTGTGFVRGVVFERWRDAQLAGTPAVAQAAAATPTADSTTLTTVAANSVVSYVNTDWNAVAPGAYAYRSAHTVETGLFDVTTTDVASYWVYQHAPTTGSQTLGMTAPTGQNWSIAGIEIQYKAPVTTPVASAGADAVWDTNAAYSRLGSGTNTPTSYSWSLTSAPAGVSTGVVDSDATLNYTPTVAGDYTFELTATNAGGSGTDSFVLTVIDGFRRGEVSAWSNTSGSPLTLTLPVTTEVGDTVVLIHANNWHTLAALAAPTGTAVTDWVQKTDATYDGGTNANHCKVWVGTVTTGGASTVIANYASPSGGDEERYAQALVFIGGAVYDVGASALQSANFNWVAASLSAAVAGSYLAIACGTPGTATNYTFPDAMIPLTERDTGGINTYRTAIEPLAAAGATGTRAISSSASIEGFIVRIIVGPAPPTMPSAVVGYATATAGGTAISVTKAAVESSRGGTVANGDVLVAVESCDQGVIGDLVASTGTWNTRLSLDPFSGGGGTKVKVFTRVASSEPASWSFAQNSNSDGVVTVICLRGVDESAVIGAIQSTAAGASRAIPAVDHAGIAGSVELAGAGVDPGAGGATWTVPDPWVELADAQSTTWTSCVVGVRDSLTDPSATDTFTTSIGTTQGVQWALVVPPTTGGGGATHILGKDTNGTQSSASTANKTAVSRFTADATGVLDVGHARLSLTGGSTVCKLFVYADSSNLPGALLAASDEVTISNTTEAVVDFVFTGANRIDITNGTAYHLGPGWADLGTDSLNISRDATASMRQEVNAYGPNPFGTPTAQSGPIDAWVEYVEPTIDATRFFLATP